MVNVRVLVEADVLCPVDNVALPSRWQVTVLKCRHCPLWSTALEVACK